MHLFEGGKNPAFYKTPCRTGKKKVYVENVIWPPDTRPISFSLYAIDYFLIFFGPVYILSPASIGMVR